VTAKVDLERFERLRDVSMRVQADLDRRPISLRELLALRVEDVVVLNRPAGENIDVYAGGALLASAEVLVVENRLAVRIADLQGQAGVGPANNPVTGHLGSGVE